MLDRDACERRVYRLATLLTGNPTAATTVIAQVVDAQPDVRRLDSAHLDRLTVLRSREIAPAMIADDRVDPALRTALAALTAQQREAWVFGRVYELDDRAMSRAMDCSVTATRRHTEQADESVRRALGDNSPSAALAVRQYAMSLDVPAFYRAERRRRRQFRLAMKIAAVALIALLLAALALWWTRPISGN